MVDDTTAAQGREFVTLRGWLRRGRDAQRPKWTPPPDSHYCPHGYCWPRADHPAAGLETCPQGCDTYVGSGL